MTSSDPLQDVLQDASCTECAIQAKAHPSLASEFALRLLGILTKESAAWHDLETLTQGRDAMAAALTQSVPFIVLTFERQR